MQPRWFRIVTAFVAVVDTVAALYGFIRAWVTGAAAITPQFSLDPGFAMQVYAGLFAGGIALFVILSWPWFIERRPAARLRKMAPLIETAMLNVSLVTNQGTATVHDSHFDSSTRAVMNELVARLEDLHIPFPPQPRRRETMKDWALFLPRLLAMAKLGDLKRAKKLWSAEDSGAKSHSC